MNKDATERLLGQARRLRCLSRAGRAARGGICAQCRKESGGGRWTCAKTAGGAHGEIAISRSGTGQCRWPMRWRSRSATPITCSQRADCRLHWPRQTSRCAPAARARCEDARMIGQLTGRMGYKGDGHVLIDVAGVGYIVHVSDRTMAGLPEPGAPVRLFTELLVREDLLQLFGFLHAAGKGMAPPAHWRAGDRCKGGFGHPFGFGAGRGQPGHRPWRLGRC